MLQKMLKALADLSCESPSLTEIRKETFWLSSRHKGHVLEGAQLELKSLPPHSRRAQLLKAIILKERTA